ncbi:MULTISPECIES: amidase [Phyllobacteriaceae]|jgi:amidase|uniref:Amidase n=1 Tax=Mesorhizobium hungaricum TaxID=1566387 RepID=A0A1C2EA57_9HYPH|nr:MULTISPECIES: amidase [Mesorhizobium]MBN9237171.1 amidase [Mesorhizobium sp.]MDQ0329375.1 amidase [Mesorhizobium sp. YL-MeA3-2017]OCX23871.1 amidase [Mesorhizobium hungaricum]
MPSQRDPFNAFLDLPQVAVSHAQSGPLAGLSLAVKDIFDVAGYVTGCGNPDKGENGAAAAKTAPTVRKLLDAGARFVAKTQTDELAFSLMGQNAHFPRPVNPAAPNRVTGGSSSGSAAAVASGLADIATGSDTGGSIRAPASFCGLIGLRTTHGAISLEGTMPLAPSFDTFGWFARDIGTYEKVAEVLFGREDAVSLAHPRPFRLAALNDLLLGNVEAAEYRRMIDAIAPILGESKIAPALTHDLDDLYWCFRKLQASEAWGSHGRWIEEGDRRLGPGVKERFAYGASIDQGTVTTETACRASFRAELADRLGDDGILVLPTVPGAAPLAASSFDETQAYRERALHLLCLSGLSGFPQITLPLGTVDGAPFGISLLSPQGSDLALVRLGRRILETAGKA